MPAEKRIKKGLWWDRNWPVLEGCTPCSPACDNCFAAEYAHRFEGSLPYLRGLTTPEGKWNGTVIMRQDQLDLPLKTKKPTVWFVAERSDLFHPSVPVEYLDRIFAVMAMSPQHTFMVLTKRPERMRDYFSGWVGGSREVKTSSPNIMGELRLPFPNLWLGVTAENQEQADKRQNCILASGRHPARIPALAPTQPGRQHPCRCQAGHAQDHADLWQAHRGSDQAGAYHRLCRPIKLEDFDKELGEPYIGRDYLRVIHDPVQQEDVRGHIDWVICGGESGNKARPVHPDWVRSLRDQCAHAGVPFLFKQWGEWIECSSDSTAARSTPHSGYCSPIAYTPFKEHHNSWCYQDGRCKSARTLEEEGFCFVAKVGKKAAGRLLDGKEHLEFPRAFAC
jgi:protein gp37